MAMKFWKVEYILKKHSKRGSINLAYVVPKLSEVCNIDFIDNVAE